MAGFSTIDGVVQFVIPPNQPCRLGEKLSQPLQPLKPHYICSPLVDTNM